MPSTHTIAARGISATFEFECGFVAELIVERDGRKLNPWATVPWKSQPESDPRFAGTDPHLRRMSGDFFCAPFAAPTDPEVPAHGWTANGHWTLVAETKIEGGVTAQFRLDQQVQGAVVDKFWTLRDGHPFLYQRHTFTGGSGGITMAHHAIVKAVDGAYLRTSPKRSAETPPNAIEIPGKGNSIFRYPAETPSLADFPLADEGRRDLRNWPVGENHEDFAMLVDASGDGLAWSMVARPSEGDVAVQIKDPKILPQTMLWYSNGGRPYAPWNGEHRNVWGIEEACAWSLHGQSRSVAQNPLSDSGVPTSIMLQPDGIVSVSTAMGVLPLPKGSSRAEALVVSADRVQLDAVIVPFDSLHFRT